jgi:dihydroorotate dehydrogenase
VGTATFADPRATAKIIDGLDRWCRDHDVARVRDLIGTAHGQ